MAEATPSGRGIDGRDDAAGVWKQAAHRDGSPYLGCWVGPGGCGFSHSNMLMIKPVALFEVGGSRDKTRCLLESRGASLLAIFVGRRLGEDARQRMLTLLWEGRFR